MRVLVDANVLISAILSTQSLPRIIVNHTMSDRLTIAISIATIDEVIASWQRKPYLKQRISQPAIDELIDIIRDSGEILPRVPPPIPHYTRDHKDDYLIAHALAEQVDVLVSGDRDLLSLDGTFPFRILTPAAFVATLEEAAPELTSDGLAHDHHRQQARHHDRQESPSMSQTPARSLADFDALSFDCYGTLIDWEAGLRAGLAKVAALAPTPLDLDALLETYAGAESAVEREQPGLIYPSVIAESIRRTGAALDLDIPDALAAEIGASVPDWPAFPDSAEALTRLQQHVKLIILSNVDRASFAGSNARLGVAFDAVYTAQDVGSYKPNACNFDYLLEHIGELGIAQDRLLHVAQSLFHDHVPAKAKGLTTVWIDRRGSQPGFGATPPPAADVTPDWTFPSMAAFAAALDAAHQEQAAS